MRNIAAPKVLIKRVFRFLEEVSMAKRHCGKQDIYRHVINRSNFVVTFKGRPFSRSFGQTGPFKLIWQCGQGKEKFIHGVHSIILERKTRKDLDIFHGLTSEKVSKILKRYIEKYNFHKPRYYESLFDKDFLGQNLSDSVLNRTAVTKADWFIALIDLEKDYINGGVLIR